MKTRLSRFKSLLLLPLLGSCAMLNQAASELEQQPGAAKALVPTITADPPQLIGYPNLRSLAAYYCPTIIDNPVLQLSCAVALGAPPPPASLAFTFGMPIHAKNPNNVPIPMLDVLVSTTLFPGQGAESLGAVCVSLCGASDASCTGTPKPGACTSGQTDIRRIDDFAARVPGLLAGIASGQALNELRKSTLVAGGDLNLTLTLSMGVEQALRVIQKVVKRTVEQALQGQQVTLDIPLTATGTVFVNLPAVGRLGVGWGPLATTWHIQ